MSHREKLMSFLKGFEADCELRGLTHDSSLRYRTPIKYLIDILDQKGLDFKDTNNSILKEFLEVQKERNLSQKTIKNYFVGLSTFYDFLVFEGVVETNPIPAFRKRYLHTYKTDKRPEERKLLSVAEMSRLISNMLDPRAKAVALILAKTGVRKGELISMDLEDINWDNYSITLKPKAKRSNRIVFFDEECAIALKRWLMIRKELDVPEDCHALFVNYGSKKRIDKNRVYEDIVDTAKYLGYYDTTSDRLSDHLSPHAFRHWFTTWLIRNGMPRDYVKELRGDARHEAIDIYNHIDMEDVRREYLARIPKLGVY